VSFKESGRLGEQVIIQILAQLQHCRLADARHQIGRKILRNTFPDRENDEQNRDHLPRAERRLRD
jgi:hypothetical protein